MGKAIFITFIIFFTLLFMLGGGMVCFSCWVGEWVCLQVCLAVFLVD